MINELYKYSDLTSKIIGCAMTVHSKLGNGFPEAMYQRALEIEMNLAEIPFQREFVMPVYYREIHIGNRRVDFLAYEKIPVELKAFIKLEDAHFA